MEKIIFENAPSTKTPINAENLNQIQENAEKEINENIINLGGKILWTNPDLSVQFEQQTITLSSNDYDCYEVLYKTEASSNNYLNTGKIPKGSGTALIHISGGTSETPIRTRTVNYVSNTSLEIRASYTGSSATTTTNNNYCIPYMVIGYKTGLFE